MAEPVAVVIVCQGPPRCALSGDEAVEAQRAGCPWCDRCFVTDEQTEVWERVSDA
jgi:hypothetical protein